MDATTLATLLHTTTDSELADALLDCTHLDELLEACTRINDDPDDITHTLTETADALLDNDHRTGTLSPGHAADLLSVEGNPTHNLDALRHRHLVLAAGRPQAAPPAIHTALTDN